MLNLVWPLSRLGGVLWGRLLPPSLPSPLPCPGRGMRDLEGLSTDVPLDSEAAPGDGENFPPCLTLQSSLSWPVFFKLPFISTSCLPACLHAPHSASATFQSSEHLQLSLQRAWTGAASAPVTIRSDNEIWSREGWLIWSDSRVNYSWKWIERLVTKCLSVIATEKRTHSLCHDFFASTNHTHCWMHC